MKIVCLVFSMIGMLCGANALSANCWFTGVKHASITDEGKLRILVNLPCDALKDEMNNRMIYYGLKYPDGSKKIFFGFEIDKSTCPLMSTKTFSYFFDIERDLNRSLDFFVGIPLEPMNSEVYKMMPQDYQCEPAPFIPMPKSW